MKNLILTTLLTCLAAAMPAHAGFENFNNFPVTGSSYSNGTFLGQDGSTWSYYQCRGDITNSGPTPCLGRNRSPTGEVYSGTIAGGCGVLSFDYKRAFSTDVDLNVFVNATLVGHVTSSDTNLQSSGNLVVNQAGDIVIRFIQVTTNAGQVAIDNVSWTTYSGSTKPEPSEYPTTLSATVSDDSITVTWTDSGGANLPDGYVIKAYTNAAIAAPVDGTPPTNDLSLYDAVAVADVAHGTGTCTFQDAYDRTTYYFQIWPYANYGTSINYKTDGTAPSTNATAGILPVIIESEDFDDLTLGDWTAYSVAGVSNWGASFYGSDKFARISGFKAPDDCDDWLISPELNLTAFESPTFEFRSAYNYGGPLIELYVSTNYDGSSNPTGFTWNALTPTLSPGSFTWADSGEIDLSAYPGPSVYLAFRYITDATGTGTWEVDDMLIKGLATGGDDPNVRIQPSSLVFAQIAATAASTSSFAVLNSGTSQVLSISGVFAVSGDTALFTVGPVPATVSVGASSNVPVVYDPQGEASATHLATFRLVCNDASNPSNLVTFSGSTAAGLVSISNIQYSTAPDWDSPYYGVTVKVSGVCSYTDPDGYALSEPDGGPWSGLFIHDFYHRPEVGDEVEVQGWIDEHYGATEMQNPTNYVVLSRSNAAPVTYVTCAQATNEPYESVFLCISNVTVADVDVGGSNDVWRVGDGTGFIPVDDMCPYRFVWTNGQALAAIRGMLWYDWDIFRLEPRNDDDFVGRPVVHYSLQGLVMTPDGPKTNWYVEVWDDDIVYVGATPPASGTVVNTAGIIFPGLLDIHNHPSYNSFPTLMFNNFPFGHRDEWGEDDPEYDNWKARRSTLRSHPSVSDSATARVTKWGEILQLMAGCVTIQGQSNDDEEHSTSGVIVHNIEQFPARIYCDIFPWTQTAGEAAALRVAIDGGLVNAVLIHLCEGPDATSRAQFQSWKDDGLLDETTAIIHGTALNGADLAELGAAGGKIVWAPMSNMKLYGATANVALADQLGVLVGLSPDWTPSGCFNMLEELGYAWHLNQILYTNYFTAKEMCDMVTINNAIAAGLSNRYGKVAAGYSAGLAVIDGDTNDPYMALIHARPKDVLLTVVHGTPRYGGTNLMAQLGFGNETADVHGVMKRFNIAFNHPFLTYSTDTFANIRASLQTGHAALTPINELDSEELQFLNLALLEVGPDNVQPFRADNPIAAGPAAGFHDLGDPLSLTFRYQDFWDNETFITDLVHDIHVVAQAYPALPLQQIATNWANWETKETVSFNVGFQDMHTNYVFRFETADRFGNTRTTVLNGTVFQLTPHTGGDTDRDGMPNEWELKYAPTPTGVHALANFDADILNNLEEYIADTHPSNSGSCFNPAVTGIPPRGAVMSLTAGPTTNSRVYDAWWCADLLSGNWTPYGLDVPGAANGSAVVLTVTNNAAERYYRTGVRLPD